MGSPFSLDLGTAQGRISSSNASHGSYVYELGHANKQEFRAAAGDYHEVKQTVTFDPEAAFVRANIRIDPPTSIPSGFAWRLTVKLNGTTRVQRTITPGDITRTLTDIAIPLALANAYPATNEITYRLELVAA